MRRRSFARRCRYPRASSATRARQWTAGDAALLGIRVGRATRAVNVGERNHIHAANANTNATPSSGRSAIDEVRKPPTPRRTPHTKMSQQTLDYATGSKRWRLSLRVLIARSLAFSIASLILYA